MATVTSRGLTVWDLEADQFSHTQLSANMNLIDSYWTGFDATTKLPKRIMTAATLPSTPAANDIVMLTADNGGYRSNSLVRYDGSAWRPVNHLEIQATVPTTGNFAGRVVILSAASVSGGITYDAWSIIRFDGTNWALIGGWSSINNGAAASNIKGLQQALDAYISDSARGLVLVDRVSGTKYRLYFQGGTLGTEVVT